MSADPIDNACDREQMDTEKAIAAVRKAASDIPKGKPGECIKCGEFNHRLVKKVCSPCRDWYKL